MKCFNVLNVYHWMEIVYSICSLFYEIGALTTVTVVVVIFACYGSVCRSHPHDSPPLVKAQRHLISSKCERTWKDGKTLLYHITQCRMKI